jgi:predicted ATPase
LSSARDVDGIVHAVSSGLNVPLGRADPVQQLGAAIAGRGACLVILDNFEQVVGHAEATLGRWLERAPQAVFIATSREVLSIAGEQLLTLPPMHGDEADALFRARVQAHGLSSDFDGPDEQAVSPLMELLDGLPLAIELAAARTQLIPPRELLQRMSSRFDLLAARGGRRDRQATLRAALDWSWELLSPAEQSALAQMSVFEGGFTLQAAEAVLDLSAHPHAAALVNLVQALVEKSLLRQALPSRRLNLSRTVHDYALQQLAVYCAAASDDKAGALSEARHGRYYAGLHATRSDAELTTEMENLVVATHRAVAAQNRDTALGALQGAWGALKLRGPFRAVIDLADKVRSIAGIDAACRGRIDWIAGWALKSGGRSDEARACFEAALQTARAANDRAWEGDVLSLLGDLHVNAGRFDEGRRALTAALDIALSAGHGVLACRVHTGLGILHWRLGDLDQARAQHEAALTAARRAGDRHWEGGSLGNLGAMHASIGHMAEAESLYLQALAIARELGDRTFEGNTLCNLGLLHHVRGEYARAAVALETALVAARELGHAQLEGVVLCNLGMTMEAMHEAAAALGHYEAALRIAREMRDTRTQGQVLGYLGTLLGRQGRFVEGLACLREGAQLLEATPDKLSLALLLSGRAECEHLAGNADAAREAWQSAQTLAAHLGTAAGAELNQALARVSALIRPA